MGDRSALGLSRRGVGGRGLRRRAAAAAAGSTSNSAVGAAGARLRAIHPIMVLRWLRAGVLAMVAVTALLYLVVSAAADDQIADARRTQRSIADIAGARAAAEGAKVALEKAFDTEQVELIGTGTDFANLTARVNTYVTSAAAGNAAGRQGLTQIQFVQGQLTTCLQLADAAVRDYSRSGRSSMDAASNALTGPRERDPKTGEAIPGTGGLTESLDDLNDLESGALDGQRHSNWLAASYVWSLLIGPVIAMLVLVVVTDRVAVRKFRRYISPGLWVALLATAAVGVTAGVLAGNDVHHLSAHPLAGHPVTVALSLSLLGVAGVLAFLAYRPHFAEYRFTRP